MRGDGAVDLCISVRIDNYCGGLNVSIPCPEVRHEQRVRWNDCANRSMHFAPPRSPAIASNAWNVSA